MLAKLAHFKRVSLQIQNVDSRSITQLLQNLRPLFLKTKDDFTGNDKGLFIL